MTHSDTDSAGVVGLNGLSDYEVAERIRSGQTNAYKETTSRSAASIVRANVFTIFNAILGAALVHAFALESRIIPGDGSVQNLSVLTTNLTLSLH